VKLFFGFGFEMRTNEIESINEDIEFVKLFYV